MLRFIDSLQRPFVNSQDDNLDNILNLASLPADIIRNIITFVENESLEPARLISPSWNSLVLDAYDKTKIDKFRCDFSCFSHSRWYAGKSVLRTLKFSGANGNINWTIHANNEDSNLGRKMLQKMRNCSKIAVLELYLRVNFSNTLDTLRKYLDSMEVHTLKIITLRYFFHETVDTLLQIVRSYKIKNIEITSTTMCDEFLGRFIETAMVDCRYKVQSIKALLEGEKKRSIQYSMSYQRKFWEPFVNSLPADRPFTVQFYPNEDPNADSNLKIHVMRND